MKTAIKILEDEQVRYRMLLGCNSSVNNEHHKEIKELEHAKNILNESCMSSKKKPKRYRAYR